MRVNDIQRTAVADGIEWSATVSGAGEDHVVRFGGPAELVGKADASMFVAAMLLPAMAWQQDLHVDGPVSPALLGRMDRLTRSYHAMDPTLRVPEVTAAEEALPTSEGSATACFFSRGVDSTYSASVPRTEPAPLDALVYCRTLEPVHDAANRDAELTQARRVAERLGLPLHPIWTDLRTFTDPMLGWSTMHGAGLAAMALLVGQAFDHVVVPTAYDLSWLPPCGSHPAIDPLFSTEAVTVYHDHLDRHRMAKVQFLVDERPDLLELLKVCYSENRIDNCGQCHKCLMTMAALRAAGGLHLATQFPQELDLAAVRVFRKAPITVRGLWVPIHRAAEARGDLELRDAVGDMIRGGAVPPLGELLAGRSRVLDRLLGTTAAKAYDPDRSDIFERFDNAYSNGLLGMVRHGEVRPQGVVPPKKLWASTVVGSVAASIQHRRAKRS